MPEAACACAATRLGVPHAPAEVTARPRRLDGPVAEAHPDA